MRVVGSYVVDVVAVSVIMWKISLDKSRKLNTFFLLAQIYLSRGSSNELA